MGHGDMGHGGNADVVSLWMMCEEATLKSDVNFLQNRAAFNGSPKFHKFKCYAANNEDAKFICKKK